MTKLAFDEDGRGYGLTAIVNLCILRPNLDEVLLIHRRNPPYEGYWGMPGGKIKDNEEHRDAGARELKEETGLIQKPRFQIGVCHERIWENGEVVYIFYINFLKFITKAKIRKKSAEGELRWYKLSELEKIKVIPSDPVMIDCFVFKNKHYLTTEIVKENGNYRLDNFFDVPHDFKIKERRGESGIKNEYSNLF